MIPCIDSRRCIFDSHYHFHILFKKDLFLQFSLFSLGWSLNFPNIVPAWNFGWGIFNFVDKLYILLEKFISDGKDGIIRRLLELWCFIPGVDFGGCILHSLYDINVLLKQLLFTFVQELLHSVLIFQDVQILPWFYFQVFRFYLSYFLVSDFICFDLFYIATASAFVIGC